MFPLFLCILWQFRATKGSMDWVFADVSSGSSANVELWRGSEPREPEREALGLCGQGRRGRKAFSPTPPLSIQQLYNLLIAFLFAMKVKASNEAAVSHSWPGTMFFSEGVSQVAHW